MEGVVKNKSKSSRKRKEAINSNSAEQNKEGVASKSDAMAVVIGDNVNIFDEDQFHKITGLTIGSTSFPENKQDINQSSIIKEFFGGNHMIKKT
ncbi:hypothetical protein Scep_014195 [Stephania cephalantha]|uniref:Uncharacterized protein n=1 Tax=Stephania cephalantha TaxID=152367 RepID=A0AAP0P0C6_9MAGN